MQEREDEVLQRFETAWAAYRYPVFFYLCAFGLILLAQQPTVGACLILALGMLIPACILMFLLFGYEWQRVFSIGAIVPAALLLCGSVTILVYCSFSGWDELDEFEGSAAFVTAALVGIPPCGVAMLGLRRLLLRQQEKQEAKPNATAYQFNIKAMFVFTTVCAIGCLVLFTLPDFAAMTAMLLLMSVLITLWLGILFLSSNNELQKLKWMRHASIAASVPMAAMLSLVVSLLVVSIFDSFDVLNDSGITMAVKVTFGVLLLVTATFAFLGTTVAKRLSAKNACPQAEDPEAKAIVQD